MALISVPFTFSAGATIIASEHNSNFSTIYNEFNGLITTANISPSAAIVDTQLATISTAGKVSGSALNILGLTTVTAVGTDFTYISDTSDSGNPKKVLVSDFSYTPTAANALAGSVVQVVNVQTGEVATGTGVIPWDDTIPQNNEGDEYMTLAITPTSATNKLKIDVHINAANSLSANFTAALFQDSTANALAAQTELADAANQEYPMSFSHYMTSGTTSSTTFKVRAGGGAAGTTTFNGVSGGRKLGGVIASSITITEIKV